MHPRFSWFVRPHLPLGVRVCPILWAAIECYCKMSIAFAARPPAAPGVWFCATVPHGGNAARGVDLKWFVARVGETIVCCERSASWTRRSGGDLQQWDRVGSAQDNTPSVLPLKQILVQQMHRAVI